MAQYYDFFFSFASIDWKKGKKDDLEILFNDLKAKLSEFGLHGSGFFAPDSIERGKEWEKELKEAMPASSVLVPIYSPNYFKSVWCGKEWEVFWQREQQNRNTPPADVNRPEVILPVVWTANFLELPPRVLKVQYRDAVSDAAVYNARGLGYMMQSPKRFPGKYGDFVHEFATELATMVKAQGAPQMRPLPNLDELDLPFPADHKRGLSHVQYVFLAGRKDEMENIRGQRDCYGTYENRHDWRPCFPDIDQVAGDLARAVAMGSGKSGCEFVQPSTVPQLIEALRNASARKNVIAIVLDPWSLSLGNFKEFAEKFDTEVCPTSGVIVMLNEKDAETAAKLPELKKRIDGHFRGRIARQEYFKDAVKTPEELREALIAIFNTAQERLVERGQIPPVGPTDAVARPLLSVKT